jgi:hypothetical protein
MATMAISRLLGRRQQIGSGGSQLHQRRDLDLAIHSGAVVEHHAIEWKRRPFLDSALDEFRVAAVFGFQHNQLGGCDEQFNSYEFAESGDPPAIRQQRSLPAQNAIKWKCSSGRQSLSLPTFFWLLF